MEGVAGEGVSDEIQHDDERAPQEDVGNQHWVAKVVDVAYPAVWYEDGQLGERQDELCAVRVAQKGGVRHHAHQELLYVLGDEDGVANTVEPLADDQTSLDQCASSPTSRAPPDRCEGACVAAAIAVAPVVMAAEDGILGFH